MNLATTAPDQRSDALVCSRIRFGGLTNRTQAPVAERFDASRRSAFLLSQEVGIRRSERLCVRSGALLTRELIRLTSGKVAGEVVAGEADVDANVTGDVTQTRVDFS